MTTKPALLGGTPAFPDGLPFARPTIEDPGAVLARIEASLESGMVTNGPTMRELEARTAEAFGVEHCVAVSSATAGLMLVIQALDPAGPVLLPSFTFSATAHAVAWNHRPILFADCDPDTWCLTPANLYDRPALIIGVHVSGVPADVEGLAATAKELGADLMFDAAHGAGSLIDIDGTTRPLGGFGRAEVFSLTPTKVLSGAEGGLVTTNDADLAEHLRWARDYGNPGDYDTRFPGLNARLSELHAAMALASLESPRGAGGAPQRRGRPLPDRPGRDPRNRVPDRPGRVAQLLQGLHRAGRRGRIRLQPGGCRGSPPRRGYPDPALLLTARAPPAGLRRGRRARPFRSPTGSPSQVISLPIWSHLPLETADRIGEASSASRPTPGRLRTRSGPVSRPDRVGGIHRPQVPTRSARARPANTSQDQAPRSSASSPRAAATNPTWTAAEMKAMLRIDMPRSCNWS